MSGIHYYELLDLLLILIYIKCKNKGWIQYYNNNSSHNDYEQSQHWLEVSQLSDPNAVAAWDSWRYELSIWDYY